MTLLQELHESVADSVTKLEESGNYKQAKRLLLAFLSIRNKVNEKKWQYMDVNPQAIISGEENEFTPL